MKWTLLDPRTGFTSGSKDARIIADSSSFVKQKSAFLNLFFEEVLLLS